MILMTVRSILSIVFISLDHVLSRKHIFLLPSFIIALMFLLKYHTPPPDSRSWLRPRNTGFNSHQRSSVEDAGSPNTTLSVVSLVLLGKCYRFRSVAISCEHSFMFSIGRHTMVSCYSLCKRIFLNGY